MIACTSPSGRYRTKLRVASACAGSSVRTASLFPPRSGSRMHTSPLPAWSPAMACHSTTSTLPQPASRGGPFRAFRGMPSVGRIRDRLDLEEADPALGTSQAAIVGRSGPGLEISATVLDTFSGLSFSARSACDTIPMHRPSSSTTGMRLI
jgi:hypothetical protein